jgi:hypothetical protein
MRIVPLSIKAINGFVRFRLHVDGAVPATSYETLVDLLLQISRLTWSFVTRGANSSGKPVM